MYKNKYLLKYFIKQNSMIKDNFSFKIYFKFYFIIKLFINSLLIAFIIQNKPFNNNLLRIKNFNLQKIVHEMLLYKEDKKSNLNNKNVINICMALDNNIIYQTLVSMISALENNINKKNILSYNLLLSNDFNKENIQIFESLKSNYPVRINYYIIPNIFSKFKSWHHGTHCHYYKISHFILFCSFDDNIYFLATLNLKIQRQKKQKILPCIKKSS